VSVAIHAPDSDPATLLTGYTARLYDEDQEIVSSENLPVTARSARFSTLPPGTYTVALVAHYTEGSSAPTMSTPVTLLLPQIVTRPVVKGSPLVGSTLRCDPGTWSWSGSTRVTTTWRAGGRAIATSRTLHVTPRQVGRWISCRVVVTARGGAKVAFATRPEKASRPLRSTSPPNLTGTTAVGSELTCMTGGWSRVGTLAISYLWLRDGELVAEARSAGTYLVARADAGHRLACRVTVMAAGQTRSATTRALRVAG
jgi:hypothetical protein